METMFEANFKPDRDFLDYIEIKKDRHFEQFYEKTAENAKKKKEQQQEGSSLVDDQDLRPMDLDVEQQMQL